MLLLRAGEWRRKRCSVEARQLTTSTGRTASSAILTGALAVGTAAQDERLGAALLWCLVRPALEAVLGFMDPGILAVLALETEEVGAVVGGGGGGVTLVVDRVVDDDDDDDTDVVVEEDEDDFGFGSLETGVSFS
mmetsp:Transcript_42854/g.108200  ORF Transcript_42854/g.108200 Transcript_42854/m.108200 type:complete len:135 (-) Transcript_42854:868-1272(-)